MECQMFIYTFKANKRMLIGLGMVIAALLLLFFLIPGSSKQTAADALPSLAAKSNQERIAFIEHFGYDVIKEPVETKDVIIPVRFDDTYTDYNALQLTQGFDLEKFKGKRVKSYAYAVTNYPGEDNSAQTVRANLLVYNGRIIGADVCSVRLDGFMHALSDGKT